MNRTPLVFCLSVAISLLMLQSVLAEVYRHVPTGIMFPDRIATLEKEAQVTDYEAKHPGLGVSVGYNGPGIAATVYVYTMGMKTIPDDLDSFIMKNQFKQSTGEIVRAGEMGYCSNVKKISDGKVLWGEAGTGTKSLHAFYNFTQRGQDCLSHIYIMGFRNHFLKVRFTYDKEIQEAAEKTQKEFLGDFSLILGGIRKEMHKQGVQTTR